MAREARMSNRLAKCAYLAAGIALCSPAFADALSDGAATIPGGVEDVRIGGTWQAGGKSGVYRIVIARTGGETVTARLFVQWIAYRDAGEASVEKSMEINEVAAQGLDVVDYVSESDADGLAVYLQTIDAADGTNEQYELYIFGPDDYRFGPATN
jgi:hypothetical protein